MRIGEPDYYKSNGLSPLQAFNQGLISEEEYLGFLKGNIIKYVVRAGKKEDAVKDIDKAIDYCHHLKRYYLENPQKSASQELREILVGDEKHAD